MSEDPPFPEAEVEALGTGSRTAEARAEGRGPLVVLAYLWVFCVVPLAVERRDPEVRWHARHGLVLLVAEAVALFACGFASALVAIAVPRADAHLAILEPWAVLLVLWLHVVAAWEALHDRRLRIPGISHYADSRGDVRP